MVHELHPKKGSTNQKRGWGKVTPIKDKESKPSQMTPPVSLYDKRFISCIKKDEPIKRGGGAKSHQLKTRSPNQVK